MAKRILLLSVLWMALLFLAMEASDGVASQTELSPEGPPASSTAPPPSSSLNGTASPPSSLNSTAPPPSSSLNVTSLPPSANETQPSTTPKDPCQSEPCGGGSSCRPGFGMTHTCLCPAGDQYNNDTNTCVSAKVYPAEFQTKETYVEEMADPTSEEFKELSEKIETSIELMLKGVPGSTPVVLKLLPFRPVASESRADEEKVKAIVDIIFPAESEVTSEKVTEALKKECETCSVQGTVTVQNLCEVDACDSISSSCTPGDGEFTCTCLDGYKPLDSKNRNCIAACPIGQTMKDDKCVDCDFGYTGFNCEEVWERDLLIVGSVLGGLLLIAFILVIVFATKKPKKSSKKSKSADMGKSFNGHPPVNTQNSHSNFDFNHAGAGHRPANGFGNVGHSEVPRIPRATTNGGWDSRTNLEMTPSHSRQNLIAPTRPMNNPYTQNRPQANHYAQNQGHNNPYYM